MQINLREIQGNWNKGFALDKHKISSTYIGDNQWGRPMFDTKRTEAGEALYQLKYKYDWEQVDALAQAVAQHIVPRLPQIGLIVPMPASSWRARQPVTEVARALGQVMKVPLFENLLTKKTGGPKLKDLPTREARIEALANAFTVADTIAGDQAWNVLLLDDLYDSGATAQAACQALRTYRKISGVYVATLTSTV
ncbi:hypothetical protein R69658_05427 [Paraburkholderia aspalathi]|uniref:ComF family protein n=1 Tax=Paraburkholderia aspalathi TaxID=1324617 RepID=A0ABM8SID3_9BURK|nr:ComF family protein [Paraburkholderia aspalathi]MBK3821802.1 ComF family protein [Paraburkholderia aspalathi]MBK3833594.1 ComF family protein [Paraburkholderia aspalathi]MBK3863317.1 ComF family protein [Paraburkholderia aspalathi]CAE6811532.1 hypothetical protein R69658_05427 [Paraburkholderia aspalathi]